MPPNQTDIPPLLPLFLKGEGLRCLLVGGGSVACDKLWQLLEVHAQVTVVAPQADPWIEELHSAGNIGWRPRTYCTEDIGACHLVIAATNQRDLNRKIHDDACARQVLINVVDDPELCTVFFPAIWRDGALTGAISTSGQAPFLCREFRNRLKILTKGWGDWLEAGHSFRELVRRKTADSTDRKNLHQQFIALGHKEGSIKTSPDQTPTEWLKEWESHPLVTGKTDE